jgi:hypothetical protein
MLGSIKKFSAKFLKAKPRKLMVTVANTSAKEGPETWWHERRRRKPRGHRHGGRCIFLQEHSSEI